MAKLVGSVRREAEAVAKTLAALGVLGLVTASAAITLVVSGSPLWFDNSVYVGAVSGAFFAGIAELLAAVWVLSTGHMATATGKMVVYGAAPLAAAAGLSAVVSLLW